ncbi:isochorismatase family cysteine hydrolase [Comamonadaceae bacterium PP-2]
MQVRKNMPADSSRAAVKAKRALVLIDFFNQFDFPQAHLLVGSAWQAAQATHRLKQQFLRREEIVIYANDNYGRWNLSFSDLIEDCQQLPGLPGKIARLMSPGPSDFRIIKPRHSGFFGTPLDLILREHRVREIIVTGIATDICVQFTVVDAYMHGYRCWVPGNCTAAETEFLKQQALQHMSKTMKCDVSDAESES